MMLKGLSSVVPSLWKNLTRSEKKQQNNKKKTTTDLNTFKHNLKKQYQGISRT